MKFLPTVLLAASVLSAVSCGNSGQTGETTETGDSATTATGPKAIDPKAFEQTIDGKQTRLYTLKNKNIEATVTNYGARVVTLTVPDKDGKATNVVLGFDNVQSYGEGGDTYFGAVVGRYGNRIAKGKFKLDGKEYSLVTNNGVNHLHGGTKGFSRVVWEGQQTNDSSLVLSYTSPDGEEGYPGALTAKVTYTVTAAGELKIGYDISTDKKTVFNLTNHSYFNLNGEGSGTINNHLLQLNADNCTPVDSTLIPLGKVEPVANTPLDFRTAQTIGARVNDSSNIQMKYGKGYDHNFVINGSKLGVLTKAAEATGDQSGIVMDVYTTEPGVQFYGGNFMTGNHTLNNGTKDDYRTAFCLETQHYPNSPNTAAFPSVVLNPGKNYSTTTVYTFSVKK